MSCTYPRDYHGNPALCLEAFWLVTCQVAAKMWIRTFQNSLACRNNHRRNGVPSAKIVPNKIAEKQYLLRSFLEILGYKTFVNVYFILPEILSVINSRESGFSRILKSEGGYWVPETLVEQSKTVPETLVEQSKTRNEHGSGTQIVYVRATFLAPRNLARKSRENVHVGTRLSLART
jgi:hypothetical protein